MDRLSTSKLSLSNSLQIFQMIKKAIKDSSLYNAQMLHLTRTLPIDYILHMINAIINIRACMRLGIGPEEP